MRAKPTDRGRRPHIYHPPVSPTTARAPADLNMSRASCAATLGHLAEYRGIVDTLTKLLDDEAAADVPAALERLAAVDTRLQQSASKLLNERSQLERTAALSERAAERRTELLQLASKLQRSEAHLSTLAAQAPAEGQA